MAPYRTESVHFSVLLNSAAKRSLHQRQSPEKARDFVGQNCAQKVAFPAQTVRHPKSDLGGEKTP